MNSKFKLQNTLYVRRPLNIVLTALLAAAIGPSIFAQHDGHDHGDHSAHDHSEHSAGNHGDGEESGLVKLTDEQLKDFKVAVEVADAAEIAVLLMLAGEIKLNEDATAHVSPRYDSVVLSVRSRLGDEVEAGQVLAELESTDTLVKYEIKAPMEGTVIARHITLGEAVAATSYLYVIADLSQVWADFHVYQRDLAVVNKGQSVMVDAGHDVPSATGKISYLGPVVSGETRTGLARVFLANTEGHWKPGMFVAGYVTTGELTVPVAVKKSAIQQIDGTPVVFVRERDGFEAREIEVGERDSTYVEILSGVRYGEKYASD